MLDATIVDRSQGVRDGMVWIPGCTFRMGSNRHYPEEAPVHRVTVDGFWMDRTPVTNREFRAFVEATGYVTFAEIAPDPKDYLGALAHMLKAGSLNRYLINSPILHAMKTNADGSLTLYIQSKTPGADKEANDPLARVQAMLIILTLYFGPGLARYIQTSGVDPCHRAVASANIWRIAVPNLHSEGRFFRSGKSRFQRPLTREIRFIGPGREPAVHSMVKAVQTNVT
jgi:hypothetical protein